MATRSKNLALRLLVALVFVWALAARAESSLPRIRARLGFVYEAVVATVGADGAERLFQHWTDEDVAALELRLQGLVRQLPSARDADAATVLHGRWGRNVLGAIGEAYGTAILRLTLPPGTLHLGEHEYNLLNGHEEGRALRRVDGLFYVIDGNRIVVTRILESKIGGASFNRQQLNGVLEVWKRNGLQTPHRRFPADSIDLNLGDERVSLSALNPSDVDRVVSLVSSRNRPNPTYQVIQMPLTSGQLRDSVKRITASGLSAQERAACLDHIGRAEQAMLRPRLDALATFIERERRWPSSRAKAKSEEHRLAMWIAGYENPVTGQTGQAGVYPYLSSEHRAIYKIRLRVDGEGMYREVLEQRLMLEPRELLDLRLVIHPENVVNEWMTKHRRWPSQRADDEEEWRLAVWLNGFKNATTNTTGCQAFYRQHLSPENLLIPEILGAVDPHGLWMAVVDGAIAMNAAEILELRFRVHPEALLDEWITEHEGWPSTRAPNGSLESKLAGWVYGYKDGDGRKSLAAVYVLLSPANQRLPAIQVAVRRQEEQRAGARVLSDEQRSQVLLPPERLNRFIRTNQKWPRPSAKRGSEEKSLADWVRHQPNATQGVWRNSLDEDNKAIFAIRLTGDTQAYWDDYRSGRVTLTDEQVLQLRMTLHPLEYLDEWIAAHSRFPNQYVEKGTPERKLAQWIQGQGGMAAVYPRLSSPNRALFSVRTAVEPARLWSDYRWGRVKPPSDEALLDLRMILHPASVINEWIGREKRWPRANSKQADALERRLGTWINANGAQRAFHDQHLSASNRRQFRIRLEMDPKGLLAEARSGRVTLTEDELWDVRYAAEPEILVLEFVEANQHWPRQQTGPFTEQRLFRWINSYQYRSLRGRDAVYHGLLSPSLRLHVPKPDVCVESLGNEAREAS